MQSSLRRANLGQNQLDIAAELHAFDSVGTGGRALQEGPVCLHVVIKEGSLRLTDLRKIMGRSSTKLSKNHTEKHNVLVYTFRRTMLNIVPLLFHLFLTTVL